MNPWKPESSEKVLRRVGKLGEECSELGERINILSKRCFRIVIQGIKGIDPDTEQENVEELGKEVADVYAQLDETIEMLEALREGMKHDIENRRVSKRKLMQDWEAHFSD